MKILNKVFKFLAIFVGGMMFINSIEVLAGRDGTFGGEALVVPLMILLFYFGYSVGNEIGYRLGQKEVKIRSKTCQRLVTGNSKKYWKSIQEIEDRNNSSI